MAFGDAKKAKKVFLKNYPHYGLTAVLDEIRKREFKRLDKTGHVYLDYMGGSLYPESLVQWHAKLLKKSTFGNTHSVSPSSILSTTYADQTRAAVLNFFDAGDDYSVIFTANSTAALKIVAESFPFTHDSHLVLAADSHNSVNGIRSYAQRGGATVCYLRAGRFGHFDHEAAKDVLTSCRRTEGEAYSLLALTGQSNVSGFKPNLALIKHASQMGFHTILDGAALAPTSSISLRTTPVDAMTVSFYKMFGYPTGIGAVIAKKEFLDILCKPWFCGGTVDVVQVPGNIVTFAKDHHERFEEGTLNYLALPAVSEGLRFLRPLMPLLVTRLSALTHFLYTSLSAVRYKGTNTAVVKVLSRPPQELPVKGRMRHGFLVSVLFLSSKGEVIPISFVAWWAASLKISLRVGCVCNPGGVTSLLGLQKEMAQLEPGTTMETFEEALGREAGVVRVSLGLASNFEDVYRFIHFANMFKDEDKRTAVWERWNMKK